MTDLSLPLTKEQIAAIVDLAANCDEVALIYRRAKHGDHAADQQEQWAALVRALLSAYEAQQQELSTLHREAGLWARESNLKVDRIIELETQMLELKEHLQDVNADWTNALKALRAQVAALTATQK